MDFYDFVSICLEYYGFVWKLGFCMDGYDFVWIIWIIWTFVWILVGSISRV